MTKWARAAISITVVVICVYLIAAEYNSSDANGSSRPSVSIAAQPADRDAGRATSAKAGIGVIQSTQLEARQLLLLGLALLSISTVVRLLYPTLTGVVAEQESEFQQQRSNNRMRPGTVKRFRTKRG